MLNLGLMKIWLVSASVFFCFQQKRLSLIPIRAVECVFKGRRSPWIDSVRAHLMMAFVLLVIAGLQKTPCFRALPRIEGLPHRYW